MHASAARAPRGGRERRVSLRKPVVVRRDRCTAYRHSGGLRDGPIGFPKTHPSLPPGERAVRVRTETLPRSGDTRPRARVEAMRGSLITFEGVEGSGKTTQMLRLERALRGEGHHVERTREPDGTALGLAVRRLFERPGIRPEPLVEVFLFMAARRQHVTEKIGPWLARGRVVLCDRYTDATVAYQGYGRGVDLDLIRELTVPAPGGVRPDLTLLF